MICLYNKNLKIKIKEKCVFKSKLILILLFILQSSGVFAADTYIDGDVYDITSIENGLLIRVKGNVVPTKCENPNGWGWMLIPEENKTMISVALAMFVQGKTHATIYTKNTGTGFCKVIQYDPAN